MAAFFFKPACIRWPKYDTVPSSHQSWLVCFVLTVGWTELELICQAFKRIIRPHESLNVPVMIHPSYSGVIQPLPCNSEGIDTGTRHHGFPMNRWITRPTPTPPPPSFPLVAPTSGQNFHLTMTNIKSCQADCHELLKHIRAPQSTNRLQQLSFASSGQNVMFVSMMYQNLTIASTFAKHVQAAKGEKSRISMTTPPFL